MTVSDFIRQKLLGKDEGFPTFTCPVCGKQYLRQVRCPCSNRLTTSTTSTGV